MLLWRSLTLQRLNFGLAGMAGVGHAAARPSTIRFDRQPGSGHTSPAAGLAGEDPADIGSSAHPKVVPLAVSGGEAD